MMYLVLRLLIQPNDVVKGVRKVLKKTSKLYRNMVMYSVWVRNHTEQGTFCELVKDLDRIKKLGVDIIWLLPIHPIGRVSRKGELGSPYAIADYKKINYEFGTYQDFEKLVEEIHSRNMKVIIDVVFNHTSPDSWLVCNHPEWFYHLEDGSFGNRAGVWSDVIDLDYSNKELWMYQIDILKQWAEIVDGFRCDVAPLLPLEFWIEAREEVEKVRPGCIWLAESVEPSFILNNRAKGLISLSDSELYQAFDICYDYDIHAYFRGYLEEANTLAEYVEKINQQEAIYPADYIKLRNLENHDQPRATSIISNELVLRNWTAFIYFQKGMTLLYAGQEKGDNNRPSLFDKDVVNWDQGPDLSALMAKLHVIKKHPLFTNSRYEANAKNNSIIYATHIKDERCLNGIFTVGSESGSVNVVAPDGKYTNLIDNSDVVVQNGILVCDEDPIIFESLIIDNN